MCNNKSGEITEFSYSCPKTFTRIKYDQSNEKSGFITKKDNKKNDIKYLYCENNSGKPYKTSLSTCLDGSKKITEDRYLALRDEPNSSNKKIIILPKKIKTHLFTVKELQVKFMKHPIVNVIIVPLKSLSRNIWPQFLIKTKNLNTSLLII